MDSHSVGFAALYPKVYVRPAPSWIVFMRGAPPAISYCTVTEFPTAFVILVKFPRPLKYILFLSLSVIVYLVLTPSLSETEGVTSKV